MGLPCQKYGNAGIGEPTAMAGRKKSRTPDLRTREELLEQAQDLIYDAWEAVDRRTALALARKALKVSPDCGMPM
jgi:hypothetical protein